MYQLYHKSAARTFSYNISSFFFSSRRRHTRWNCDWSSDVCSSDLNCALGAFGNFAFAANLDSTEKLLHHFFGDHQAVVLALSQAPGLLAADSSDVALQIADPGFAGVLADHVAHAFLRKLDLLGCDAVLVYLPWNQILECNVAFLFFCVALQFDDLHTVAQRLCNRVKHVGGRDEENLGEGKRHVQIVIAEGRVLLGIERFQRGWRRITGECEPDF